MTGTGIIAVICTSTYPSPYPIEKVGDFSYPYPYPVNAGILRQNGDGFGQYPQGRVYFPSLIELCFLLYGLVGWSTVNRLVWLSKCSLIVQVTMLDIWRYVRHWPFKWCLTCITILWRLWRHV